MDLVSNAHHLFSESVQVLPVGHMQTVFPALNQSANDLQVVSENRPLGVEAVLHQELQQPVGEHFISGVTLRHKILLLVKVH